MCSFETNLHILREQHIHISPLAASLAPRRPPDHLPRLATDLRPRPLCGGGGPSSLGDSVLDIVPKTAISSSPIFGGVQIRCGPRPTMATTSRLVRKRRHGFLSRIRSRNGRRTLQRRKSKSRHVLSM
ncbi:hypothetical protein PG988_014544 [Apiospora saccharicola]